MESKYTEAVIFKQPANHWSRVEGSIKRRFLIKIPENVLLRLTHSVRNEVFSKQLFLSKLQYIRSPSQLRLGTTKPLIYFGQFKYTKR